MSELRRLITGITAGAFCALAQAEVTNDVAFTATYDGSTQRYVLILPDGFDPARTHDVLVCLHGHGADRWQYVNVVRGETTAARDTARRSGMLFVSPDYRATTSWMGPAAEADMLQILTALKAQYAVGRVLMTGASMGGSSALTFTALHPELVDGVVALNGLADHVSFTNFQEAIAASFGGTKAQVPEEYYKRSALYFPERFTMPLAVTAGGLDTTVPPQSVMQLAQAVQTDNPRVRIDYDAARGHSTDYAASLAAYQYVVSTGTVSTVAGAAVVAHWNFGNGLADASGNGHTLTNSGVAVSNGVAVFSGTQTVFNTAATLNLSACTNLTVEFFVRTTVTNALMMLLEQSANAGSVNGAFFFDANDVSLPGSVCSSYHCGGKWNIDKTAAGVLADGLWHHVAMVFDVTKTGADRKILYFDRVPQATLNSYTNDAFLGFCNATLYLGSRANTTYTFTGELDDVRISNAALATNQFLQARTSDAPPVAAYWRFDKGAPLSDSSGNGNSLTHSGVSFTNGAARLSGAQAAFTTLSTLDLSPYSDLTVELFMRTTAVSAPMMLVEQTSVYWQNPGAFMIDVNETNDAGRVMGGFCTAAGTKLNLDITPRNAAADGRWHHVALVYNSAASGANRAALYLDGVAQPSYAAWTNDTATAFRNATLFIGSRNNASYKFAGELDDIKITGAALAPQAFMTKRTSFDGTCVLVY